MAALDRSVSAVRPRPAGARRRDQPRRQGRQGRPALLVHRARRRRRRERRRRRRLRQGQRGPARDPEGRRAREEEPLPRAQARLDDHAPDDRASSAPAACCSSPPRPVPASSPAAACARCSSSPGIHDILSKSLGSQNPINLVKATVAGLQDLRTPEEVAELRGLSVNARARPRAARTARPRRAAEADGRAEAAEPRPTSRRRGDRREQLLITQVKSRNGAEPAQRDTLRSLGLRGIGQTVERQGHAAGARHGPRRPPPGEVEEKSMADGDRDRASRSACTTSSPPPAAAGRASASAAARARAPARPSGRGQKGYGSRSGAKERARFEGGQKPIHMRMRKLRGPHMKKSMPFEPFRTHTQPVNLDDLEARFDDGRRGHARGAARARASARARDVPVKVLGQGRADQDADRPRARLQRSRARAHRGRRRDLPASIE